eukprot:scaffold25817_cov65-Phaeocystis_antarctica.AAC.4
MSTTSPVLLPQQAPGAVHATAYPRPQQHRAAQPGADQARPQWVRRCAQHRGSQARISAATSRDRTRRLRNSAASRER